MRNIKIVIEYDGHSYHGWQSQINALSVQDVIERALYKLTGEETALTGASRTDTGVHALGQVANFFTRSAIPAEKFAFALNTMLPVDITIRDSEEVPPDFHSRFSATGKRYIYKIYNHPFPSALLRHRAYHVYLPLNLEHMQKGAACLVGTHDFSAFMATGSRVKTTVRTIRKLSVAKNGDMITLDVEGDGFLYNMVRIIAGTLVEIGMGRIRAEDVPDIISGKDRRKAGRTAPPHGLYLAEVFYG
jgi:tRNA pseudouridine38-40 synthase